MPRERLQGNTGGNKAEVKDKPQRRSGVVAKPAPQSQSPGLKALTKKREGTKGKRSDASKDGNNPTKMELPKQTKAQKAEGAGDAK